MVVVIDSLIVSNIGEQVNSANPDLIVRSITVEGVADNEKDSVQIFHYTNWPEYGESAVNTDAVEIFSGLLLLGLLASERDICSLVRHIQRAKFTQKYATSVSLLLILLANNTTNLINSINSKTKVTKISNLSHRPADSELFSHH